MTDRETQTITAADVGVLDVSVPADMTIVPPQTYSIKDLKPGMQVVFVDHKLNEHPVAMVSVPMETNAEELAGKLAMVVAVDPNAPGKQVALCFKDKIKYGHSCDRRVPDGHGAYVLAEHLYSVDAFKKHVDNAANAVADQTAINELLKGFITP